MTNTPVWDNGGWRSLPSLEGSINADLCVVGLGGSGLAAVDEAVSLGKSVVGVDAGPIAGQAAGRNGGFMLAGMALFYHDAEQRWGVEKSRQFYQKTLDELDVVMAQQSSRRVGSLRIAADDEEFEDIRSELTALQRAGFGVEEYEGSEGAGLLLPYDGVCNPLERCRGMAQSTIERGARLFENSPAIDVDSGIVRTPGGRVEADSVVVAIDGRLEVLFPELSSRTKTVRLEMLATEPFDIRFTRPVYTHWGYNYWQQLLDGRLAIGGLRHEHEDASYTTEDGPSDSLQADLDRYVRSLGVNAAITHRWAGHAGFTEDRLPIYEELKPGVWVVGGYSGHGNVIGAMYGRAATRSAVAGEMEPML